MVEARQNNGEGESRSKKGTMQMQEGEYRHFPSKGGNQDDDS